MQRFHGEVCRGLLPHEVFELTHAAARAKRKYTSLLWTLSKLQYTMLQNSPNNSCDMYLPT